MYNRKKTESKNSRIREEVDEDGNIKPCCFVKRESFESENLKLRITAICILAAILIPSYFIAKKCIKSDGEFSRKSLHRIYK